MRNKILFYLFIDFKIQSFARKILLQVGLADLMVGGEFHATSNFVSTFAGIICEVSDHITKHFCENAMFMFTGFNENQIDEVFH